MTVSKGLYRLFLGVYQTFTLITTPLAWCLFSYGYRVAKNKKKWVDQRMGKAHVPLDFHNKKVIWLHGANIGELRSAQALSDTLLKTDSAVRIVMTTQSLQALVMMQQRLVDHHRMALCLAPYDSPWCVRRFLNRWNPHCFCVMEAEIWPCLWHQTFQRNIQSLVINFHISHTSARFWSRLGPIFTCLYRPFARRWSGCSASIGRFRAMTHHVLPMAFSPTLKYASVMPPCSPLPSPKPCPAWGQRPVWMASCGHDKDEAFFYTAHQSLLHQNPTMLWIYAPRHLHRVPDILAQCHHYGWSVQKHSDNKAYNTPVSLHCQVYIIDTLGDLDTFYEQLPFVVMGGSFYPSGRGHNLIEPLACLCAPLYGPYMKNCQDVVQDCQHYGTGQQVAPHDLCHAIVTALSQTATTMHWAQQGKKLLHHRWTALQKDLGIMIHTMLDQGYDH